MKITNRKDKNTNVIKITCNENHDENHQQKKTQLWLGPLVTTNTRMRITNRKEKSMTMIISKEEKTTMALTTQQVWKYHSMLWTPIITMIMTINLGIHLYLKRQNIERERMCANGKLNFRSQTKLLAQHYQIGTMMKLCFLFVWGHYS